MRYIKLGSTGLDVSPIAIGAMTYGEPDRGHPIWSLDEAQSRPHIDDAVASLDLDLTADEISLLERPYTPRYDLQGVSDEVELQRIMRAIPGYFAHDAVSDQSTRERP